MTVNIPELSLVVLIGASGSGKTRFAQQHFQSSEILSSDACRAMVSDDETNQEATHDAFDVLYYIARKRLERGRLTVIDATNVETRARHSLIALGREYHFLMTAIVLNLPENVLIERNKIRDDRHIPHNVVHRQLRALTPSLSRLRREGFHQVIMLSSEDEIDGFKWKRQPLWNNKTHEHGPFDIVGDVHGCFDELQALTGKLGYRLLRIDGRYHIEHPQNRKLIFLGDLVDRGPGIMEVLRLVMDGVDEGSALAVMGNHESKLLQKIQGRDVTLSHGLRQSLEQLDQEPADFTKRVKDFLDSLVSHYVLDGGRLVVAHAGLPESMHGRGSARVRNFALYGETTGETDEFGLPIRYNWASDYRGKAIVVYGHTPVPYPQWLNRTLNIDTGCVFGGQLTAFRYPEKELMAVPALKTYFDPIRPLGTRTESESVNLQQEHDSLLDIADFMGQKRIHTRLIGDVVIPEENTSAALETLSRYAVSPQWLIYLPPTMSPAETSTLPGILEHPREAFSYFHTQGVSHLICEPKHMGSRAVVIVCRDEKTSRVRFGVSEESTGIVYTRTGRKFFTYPELDSQVLERIREAVERSGLFTLLKSDWLMLDAEIMPWSLKAEELLKEQYAGLGRAALMGFDAAETAFSRAQERGLALSELAERFSGKKARVEQFIQTYRRYSWPVRGIGDIKLAPFHLLASEGEVHSGRDHLWHLDMIRRLSAVDPGLFQDTKAVQIDTNDQKSIAQGVKWWEELTEQGYEGMVVKPLFYIARNSRGKLVQPAIKVRGREYLRIIYGPDYTADDNLANLRQRFVGTKRRMALREFALGIEGLNRFVDREPLRRVHECAQGVLALESEGVDSRL
ncbi:MAG: polynucleotide kinase-phosphatase [Firmicutes bacterium]|jgi:protein phosphatase|uniref:Polynucleotide kinase-phosphatase n=1 Tax=Sulfobacillus benefaciens TaxID=453960 RepID=A0A2T2X9L1_9FIRM|nr:polynucleotide kinase-phosphatase [Bacillota bacterium]MCL5013144.1 polynucleotide kinase-phosphatase [Bacillota bacterium]PSR31138.1 MAG: polynucleotide kinase-phosphatase [Sulfobacillus benefaciens]